jgi:hypothetical protein
MHPLPDRRSILGALAAIALAAAPAFADDPVFPVNSRIGLVPPPGFTPSARFTGFENAAANAALVIAELPAEAFPEMEKGFTDEAFKARGMTVTLREPMTLKDGRGIMVAGPRDSDGAKRHEVMLLAGVSGVTAVVSVQMIEASHATITDAVLRDALKTLAVRQVPEAEKLGVLPYRLGNLAGFRVVRTAPNGTALLTDGPNDAVTDVKQPFMLIGFAGGEAPKPEDRDAFARRLFSAAPGIRDIRITRAEPLRINQGAGYEIIAEAKDAKSGIDVTTVQWVRFGQSAHMQMFAIARRTAWNDTFTRLRAIRDGIELR